MNNVVTKMIQPTAYELALELTEIVREILGDCLSHPSVVDPMAEPIVAMARERGAFGSAMSSLSVAWGQMLVASGAPAGGAFTVGPCRSTCELALQHLKEIEAELKARGGDMKKTAKKAAKKSAKKSAKKAAKKIRK